MIRKLLFLLACAVTTVTAWGQSTCPQTTGIVEQQIVNDGAAVITLHGDMTGVTVADASQKAFTQAAVNNVFTESNSVYTSVVANSDYLSTGTYYSASKTWYQLYGGGVPQKDDYRVTAATTETAWNTTAIGNTNLYPITPGTSKNVWNENKLSTVKLYPAYLDNPVTVWNSNGANLYPIKDVTDKDYWTTSALTAENTYIYPATKGTSSSFWITDALSSTNLYPITVGTTKDVWNTNKLNSVYMYSGYIEGWTTLHKWNAEEIGTNYIYKLEVVWNGPNQEFKVVENVTNSAPVAETATVDGVVYELYLLSPTEIDVNTQKSKSDFAEQNQTIITQEDFNNKYTNTYNPIKVSSDRVLSGDFPTNNLGSITYNENNYIGYFLTSNTTSNGTYLNPSTVTLLTAESVQQYKQNAHPITIGTKITGTETYSSETFEYDNQNYVKYITSTSLLDANAELYIEDFGSNQKLLSATDMATYVSEKTPLNVTATRLTSGEYTAPGTYEYNGTTYVNYILSETEITENKELTLESLPSNITTLTSMDSYHGSVKIATINGDVMSGTVGYYGTFSYNDDTYAYIVKTNDTHNTNDVIVLDDNMLLTETALAAYKETYKPIFINGARVTSGEYKGDHGTFEIDGTTYVQYVKSSNDRATGDKVKTSEVDLLTQAQLDEYWRSIQPVTIGDKVTESTACSTPATFDYNSASYAKYITSTTEVTSGTVINIEDLNQETQSLLTAADMNTYINTTCTYTAGTGLYRVQNGGDKILLNAGDEYTYENGDLFYYFEASYSSIDDHEGYFFTSTGDGYGYVDAKQVSVANYIVSTINENNCSSVTIKSCDCGYATMDQAFTCQLLHLGATVKSLDLSKVQVPELVGGAPTTEGATFKWFPNSTTDYTANEGIIDLKLPHIKNATTISGREHRHVPTGICNEFNGIKNAGATKHESSISMPDNATCVEKEAFGNMYITDITLNDGLRMVGEKAFDGMHENVLTIPASMEYIGKGSFGQGYVTDVYFLGTEAPIVEMDAFGSKAYCCNNAHIVPGTEADPVVIDEGSNPKRVATRANYYNADYHSAMLHLRSDLTPAQRATFTDVTRDYHVFDIYRNATAEDDESIIVQATEVNNKKKFVRLIETAHHDVEYKVVGSGTYEKWTAGTKTQDYIMRTFWNGVVGDMTTTLSSKGGFNTSTNNSFYSGEPGADITGGETSYYDRAVGNQIQWPGQSAYDRSYTVATNGLLWDGVTTIGAGITSRQQSQAKALTASESSSTIKVSTTAGSKKYDINCDGDTDDEGEAAWTDGSEYIGSHQFVLVTSDVSSKTTEEWDFNTIAGANWYTICVPINMTVGEVRKAFGPNTQVCKFNGVTRNSNEKIRFSFTDEQCYGKEESDTAIVANSAYMIRPSNAKDATYKFTLPDFKIADKQVPVPTVLDCTDATNGKKYTYIFIGQYSTQSDGSPVCMPKYSYFLGADKTDSTIHRLFIQTGETGKWKPYTCVILNENGQDDYDTFFDPNRKNKVSGGGKSSNTFCSLGVDDYDGESNVVSAIENYEIVCGADNTAVYNLNGQMVDSNNLKKGVYIKNGKAFIAK